VLPSFKIMMTNMRHSASILSSILLGVLMFIMVIVSALFLTSLWFVFISRKNKLFCLASFILINGLIIPYILYKNSYRDFVLYEVTFALLFILPELFGSRRSRK
jgi:hypothetical protein